MTNGAATRLHVVKHAGACGLRIPSPHPKCQALAEPYLAAELATVTLAARSHVAVLRCHACGWQGAEASA